MNPNFTDRVRKVLSIAREEAVRLRHDYVGTEHQLLGIINEGSGVGAAVLTRLSVGLEQVRDQIEASIRPGKARIPAGELPYSSRAKKVMDFAVAESRELDHSYVGTEHLLLGLLREDKGIAAEVLNQLGVTLDEARRQALILLGSTPDHSAAPGSTPGRHHRPRFSNAMQVFARSALEAEAMSAEIQRWLGEREAEGFTLTDKSIHLADGFVIITVWMRKVG